MATTGDRDDDKDSQRGKHERRVAATREGGGDDTRSTKARAIHRQRPPRRHAQVIQRSFAQRAHRANYASAPRTRKCATRSPIDTHKARDSQETGILDRTLAGKGDDDDGDSKGEK